MNNAFSLSKSCIDQIDCVCIRNRIKGYNVNHFRGHIIEDRSDIDHELIRIGHEELKTHQVFYDAVFKRLIDSNNRTVTTIGKYSKFFKNTLAFVMAEDGALYIIGIQSLNQSSQYKSLIINASFLADIPVEMVGFIIVNNNGKIEMIVGESWHYAPNALDMYRGIKKLIEIMPDVFIKDAQIKYYDRGGIYINTDKINKFIETMEKPTSDDGKLVHQKLRDDRIRDLLENMEKLKNTASMVIDIIDSVETICTETEEQEDLTIDTLDNWNNCVGKFKSNDCAENKQVEIRYTIANLSPEIHQNLSKLLNKLESVITIFFRNLKDRTLIPYTLDMLTTLVISKADSTALQVLLNAGIGKRKEFQNYYPLYNALCYNQDTRMAKIILNDVNVREILKLEVSDNKNYKNSLEFLIRRENSDIIMDILKYPEGYELLQKINYSGITPLQIAKRIGNNSVIKALEEYVKHNTTVVFKEKNKTSHLP